MTVTTHQNWIVGDIINICASVRNFCGATTQAIQIHDINVTKSPTACSIEFGLPDCGIHVNNIEITFSLVKGNSSGNCVVAQTYRTLGNVRTSLNSTAGISYKVTEQDRLNYISATNEGYSYYMMACITNGDGQTVINPSITTNSIIISQEQSHLECVNGVCTQVTGIGTNTCNTIGSITECAQPTTDTHYIEYDFSALPTEFLDLINTNITFISNKVGNYIPLGNNIQYTKTIYDNQEKKFRMYFKQTQVLSLDIILNNKLVYNKLNGEIVTLVSLTDMVMVAGFVTGILILLLVLILGLLSPFIAIFGIAIGIVLLYFKLVEISNGNLSTGSGPTTPEQQIKAVKEYIETYLSPDCDILWPGCASTPPTCDAGTMRAYLGCIGPARWAQCQQANIKAGLPITDCDIYKTEIQAVDTGLANGTLTPTQAKERIINNVVIPVKNKVEEVIKLVTCPTDQSYNVNTKKCEDVCWIGNPLGGCILSAKTGKTLAYIGGGLAVGYIGYKLLSSNKQNK